VVELYRKAFTELSVDVVVLLESSEFVAWQRTIRATHSGAFKGFPGTSQPIVWREMVVSRFVGKLIGEEWVVSDLAERLLLARKAIARNGPSNAKPKKSRAETDA
jgi:predicted ester cyclase